MSGQMAKGERASSSVKGVSKADRLHAFRGNSVDDYYDHGIREFPLPSRILLGIIIVVVTVATKIAWPWKIKDAELLWNDRRGRIIVMNHQSMLDPVVTVASLWFRGMRVRPIYKSEFDKSKLVTWIFSRVGAIPVVRGTADMKFIRRAQHAIERGECVLIYPEGTRVRSDDQKIEFHKGFALIARLTKAPVQPMAIVGARNITPKGTHWKRFGRVYLKAGSCIELSELGVSGRKEQTDAMERASMRAVYDLVGELRSEHPGKM